MRYWSSEFVFRVRFVAFSLIKNELSIQTAFVNFALYIVITNIAQLLNILRALEFVSYFIKLSSIFPETHKVCNSHLNRIHMCISLNFFNNVF